MTQTDREKEKKRLYELIARSYTSNRSKWEVELFNEFMRKHEIPRLVDDLLDGGVIVPPCKVGDTVYAIAPDCEYQYVADCDASCTFCEHRRSKIETWTVKSLYQVITVLQSWGTRCFSTYEAAEQALKEQRNDKQ